MAHCRSFTGFQILGLDSAKQFLAKCLKNSASCDMATDMTNKNSSVASSSVAKPFRSASIRPWTDRNNLMSSKFQCKGTSWQLFRCSNELAFLAATKKSSVSPEGAAAEAAAALLQFRMLSMPSNRRAPSRRNRRSRSRRQRSSYGAAQGGRLGPLRDEQRRATIPTSGLGIQLMLPMPPVVVVVALIDFSFPSSSSESPHRSSSRSS